MSARKYIIKKATKLEIPEIEIQDECSKRRYQNDILIIRRTGMFLNITEAS